MTDEKRERIYAILGASGGIGSALARRLASDGATVLLGGRRLEPLETLAEEIGGHAVEVDGRDFEAVGEFLQRTSELEGELVGVANCAGSLLLKPAHLTTRAEYDEVLDTNLATAFAVVRAAGRQMRESGGSIVLVSSAAADIGLPNHEAIAAAKGAVAALTRSASASYAGRGLRFNAVAPGLVDTPMTEKIVGNEKALAGSVRLHPLARIGQPEEVADLIAWLLGPASSWVWRASKWVPDGIDMSPVEIRALR